MDIDAINEDMVRLNKQKRERIETNNEKERTNKQRKQIKQTKTQNKLTYRE